MTGPFESEGDWFSFECLGDLFISDAFVGTLRA